MLDIMPLSCKNNIQKTLKEYLYFLSQGASKGSIVHYRFLDGFYPHHCLEFLFHLFGCPERKNVDIPSGSFVYCFYMLGALCPASWTHVRVEIRVLSPR
jgi:hypothetical protein